MPDVMPTCLIVDDDRDSREGYAEYLRAFGFDVDESGDARAALALMSRRRPDIVLPRHGLAIFVHGCFWHRHTGCSFATTPASNREFWGRKFKDNVRRDRLAIAKLHEAGWRTLIVWECALRKPIDESALHMGLKTAVLASAQAQEISREGP